MHAARPQAARLHAARHRRPAPPRARRLPLVAALLGLLAALAPPTTAVAQTVDPCLGDAAPTVVSTTVNQGLGTYTPLVRGKSTLVRVFLAAPACAPLGSVELVRTRVRVLEGGRQIAEGSTVAGPVYPALPPAVPGATDDGDTNPLVVLGELGRGTATTLTSLQVLAQVTYRYRASSTGSVQEVVAPEREVARADMAPPSNGLRLLVVPMGDPRVDASVPQFPRGPAPAPGAVRGEYADTVLQKAMHTASRLLPVPDGVGGLDAPGQLGLRYTLSAGLLDLPALRVPSVGGKFCVDGQSFTQQTNGVSVSSKLKSILADYNGRNATAKADRVLGVLWQEVSGGTDPLPGTIRSCAEGLATVGGTEAYARLLVPSTVTTGGTTTPNPTMSGSLAVMELMHSLGGVSSADTRANKNGFHSGNVTADPDGTKRAYDTTRPGWIDSPYSGLLYSGQSSGYASPSTGKPSPWNDATVVLEKEDFAFAQCVLSPALPSSVPCPTGVVRGSAGVAAAAAALVIAGNTDGTRAGTALRSTFDTAVEPTQPAPDSPYRLVLRDARGLVLPACAPGTSGCSPRGDLGLPLADFSAPHLAEDGHAHSHSPLLSQALYAAVQIDPRAVSFEVWKGQPGGPCTSDALPDGCLYARSSSTPPVVTTSTTGLTFDDAVDLTPAPGDDTAPALSPDGKALAWVSPSGLRVQLRDATTGQPTGSPSAPVAGLRPSWSPDGSRLAWSTADGDIETAPVDRTGTTPTIGTATTVYDHLLQTPMFLGSTEADSPSWSPSGDALAVTINGGIWRLTVASASTRITCDLSGLTANPTCRPIVTGRPVSDPDWGTTGGADLIAYVEPDGVWTVDPAAPTTTRRLRLPSGQAPSWGAGLLAYSDGRDVLVADPAREDTSGSYLGRTRLTSLGDALPALARSSRVLAVQRSSGPTNGLDVVAGVVGQADGDLTFSATTDGDPALLRATLLLSCADPELDPVLSDLRPVSTTGAGPGSATFTARFETSRACPGGTLSAAVTNGWDVSAVTPLRTYAAAATPPAPSPSITNPTSGSTYLAYDPVYARASSVDRGVGTNGSGTRTTWSLTGPDGLTAVLPQTGEDLRLDPPLPGGRPAGAYVLSATVTGPGGATATASSRFTVLPDPQHLSANARVSFDPQTLFVPSNGNAVTMRVRPQQQDLTRVPASSVRVVSVGGLPVELPVLSWTVDAAGVGQAKVDRQVLTDHMRTTGRVGQWIAVVLQGGSGVHAFRGLDTRYPTTTPS